MRGVLAELREVSTEAGLEEEQLAARSASAQQRES